LYRRVLSKEYDDKEIKQNEISVKEPSPDTTFVSRISDAAITLMFELLLK
jgi:hypothetical protein